MSPGKTTSNPAAPEPLRVPRWIVDAMIAHARQEQPRECCGLLAGVGAAVCSVYPVTNEAASSTKYFAAAGLLAPMIEMRRRHEELLAIYHSHPTIEAVPSRGDMAQNYYPETVHFIISLAGAEPVLRAYLLAEDDYTEVRWTTVAATEQESSTADIIAV